MELARWWLSPITVLSKRTSRASKKSSVLDLRTIFENDLNEQIQEAKDNDDVIIAMGIEEELEYGRARIPAESFSNIETQEHDLTRFFNATFNNNLIWDVGFQMQYLKFHCKSTLYRHKPLTMKCYCPCGNYMKNGENTTV